MEYKSGGFLPSEYKDLPLYKLTALYKEMWADGQKYEIDNMVYREDRIFKTPNEALGMLSRLYSSIVARKAADEEIEEFGLFKPSVKVEKPVKVNSVKRSERTINMSKSARATVSMDAVITVLVEENPKKRTAKDRFAKYRTGMTVQDFVNEIGNPTLAVNDILWDTAHGWIKYEIPISDSDVEFVEGDAA